MGSEQQLPSIRNASETHTFKDIKVMFSPFVIEAHGGFGNEAKKLVRELERRRKERQCLPNMRTTESFQPLGEINLVTAIGFELVRRNVRMILDRSPEEEPLIPAEKTRIRLEMARKKRRSAGSDKRDYKYDYATDSELLEENCTESSEANDQEEVEESYEESIGRKPPDIILETDMNNLPGCCMTIGKDEMHGSLGGK